jgi:nucleotide-binding universal stress UspA family protein
MGCYRTILVAIDGSPDAEAALHHAVSLARDQHAKLVLLTVMPPPTPQMPGPGMAPPPPADPEEVFARILRDAADALPDDVGVQTRLVRGKPGRRIIEVASESCCDLIVMGFHGHGRLHQALAGSVSDTVLRASHLPVLLMRAAGPRAAPAALRAAGASQG